MRTSGLLIWSPRIAAILFAAFLSLFALDVFSEGKGFSETVAAFGMHLIPTVVLIVFILLAWKREWVSTFVFTLLGGAYLALNLSHPQWIAFISAPMFLVSVLYLLAWIKRKK